MANGSANSAVDSPLALITGAAGDIGLAAALALANDGWMLALCDHPSQRDRLLAREQLCSATGVDVTVAEFDVTDELAIEDALRRLVTERAIPTAVFNNAGIQGEFVPIDRYPIADARQVIEVNVIGVLNVLSVVSRHMITGGAGGAFVNSASMAGVGGAPNMAAYSASKAAVIGLTKSAAKDLAPHGIRVNAISPAFIGPGRMWDTQVEKQAAAGTQYFSNDLAVVAQQMIGSVPLRRYGSTAEVADVVAYLLSPRASYVTGINFEINGGSV